MNYSEEFMKDVKALSEAEFQLFLLSLFEIRYPDLNDARVDIDKGMNEMFIEVKYKKRIE